MYTEENRAQLLEEMVATVSNCPVFEGLIQIGSGAIGFADIYSDIDLMAGCAGADALETAKATLLSFFRDRDAVYMDHRKWTETALGISAYFANGLSVDISFMPTQEIPVRSKKCRLLWASNVEFEEVIAKRTEELTENDGAIVNEAFHHKFFYALRRAEIAIYRENYIYADMVLNEARQMLLLVQVIGEGKKVHHFKAYNTLDMAFSESLEKTYPRERNSMELKKAMEHLLQLYKETVEANNLCGIDSAQEKIINCFED